MMQRIEAQSKRTKRAQSQENWRIGFCAGPKELVQAMDRVLGAPA